MGSGLSSFDLLGDIPASQRTLMRLFLRRVRLTAEELDVAVTELPEEKRLTPDALRESMVALTERGWVKRAEENGQVVYSVQQIR
jgi:predicted transcriptional regulator of viral defense system